MMWTREMRKDLFLLKTPHEIDLMGRRLISHCETEVCVRIALQIVVSEGHKNVSSPGKRGESCVRGEGRVRLRPHVSNPSGGTRHYQCLEVNAERGMNERFFIMVKYIFCVDSTIIINTFASRFIWQVTPLRVCFTFGCQSCLLMHSPKRPHEVEHTYTPNACVRMMKCSLDFMIYSKLSDK